MDKTKKEKLKNQKGITLLALVITIVILIILAVVAINFAFGENGLVKYAEEARDKTINSTILETEGINNIVDQIEEILGENDTSTEPGNPDDGDGVIEGIVTFTGQDWVGDGTAKVTINTTEEEYELQYIVIRQGESTDGIENRTWTNTISGYEITELYHGDTVYGRLWDGKNESEYASSYILDNEAPIVNVTAGGTTTNSVTVSVNAVDEESGMKENPTYTYSIKVTGQDDSTYTTPENANGITSNNYTFTGLTQGTNYTVRVQVNGDKANNVGTGTLGNQTTATIGGATAGLVTGNITASTPIWSNGQASIKLSTSTGYKIMYQKNTTTGQWIEIANGGTISGLNHNDTVYARLYDGNNHGDYASVTIQDKIAPVISEFKATNVTYNSITVQVNATDAQSGIATYTYTINGGSQSSNTTGSYTFTGLNSNVQYTIQVTVVDRAGHVTTETKTISTPENPNIVTKVLKAGDYVTYPSSQGNLACRVLYDSSSGYGVQLITMDVVGNVTLGSSDFTTSMNSYNNAITTLNNAAGNYNNSTFSTARCVGSHPTSTSDNPGYFTSSYDYMSSYNGQFKNADANYDTDYGQMGTLGIRNIGNDYWLASRNVISGSIYSYFNVSNVDSSGSLNSNYLCAMGSDGTTDANSRSHGLRPVFTLNPAVKVTGGNGTSSSPYTLGV